MKTLTEQDYINAAKELGCEVSAIKAVSEVEAPKGGFQADGTPTILFERHK
ncbi:N-acetylmuramidase domain-containing protein, partial [Chryseobacterium sp. WLY505]|uniref:N-acetylmuramidase domain-containing protein n=1 Tax=Chryseobacterium sp. WLY505 TaxID=3068892 RepID=UPI00358E02A6